MLSNSVIPAAQYSGESGSSEALDGSIPPRGFLPPLPEPSGIMLLPEKQSGGVCLFYLGSLSFLSRMVEYARWGLMPQLSLGSLSLLPQALCGAQHGKQIEADCCVWEHRVRWAFGALWELLWSLPECYPCIVKSSFLLSFQQQFCTADPAVLLPGLNKLNFSLENMLVWASSCLLWETFPCSFCPPGLGLVCLL